MWVPQLCSSLSILLWLFSVSYIYKWILESACQFYNDSSWDSDKGSIEFIHHFVERFIFTIVSILVLEHEPCLSSFRHSLIFLFCSYSVQVFHLFCSFICIYFIYFDRIVHLIVLFISFLDCLLLVYKNTVDVFIESYILPSY